MKQFLWLRDVLVIFFVMIVLRSSLINWYVIPTGSMLPTIKIKDHVLVNKLAYGLMLPFMGTQIISWDTPARGDIVLFDSPVEHVTFVKRVAGTPGDQIAFQNGVLKINGELVKEEQLSDRSVLDDMRDPNEEGRIPGEGKILYKESGLNNTWHFILRNEVGGPTNYESREWVIPAGKILVMGDNRDGSNDGRYWGFVDIDKIYGRAFRVFYSILPSKGIFPEFRTDRFFAPLR